MNRSSFFRIDRSQLNRLSKKKKNVGRELGSTQQLRMQADLNESLQ